MKKLFLGLALLALADNPAFAQQQASDPCVIGAKIATAINLTASANLFSGTPARKNYICSVLMVASGAETVSLVEGTGSVCATSPLTLVGAPTAASGLALPANGILPYGNGAGTLAAGNNANFNVCLLKSGSNRIGGVITYVQQ